MQFKSSEMVIRNMIDVWSKKGVVLLNVSPTAGGEITMEQQDILNTIGEWIRTYKEAVYETRAHSIFGYGIAEFEKGEFGGQAATMKYTKDDIRFAKSTDGSILYVYVLGLPTPNSEFEFEHVFDSNKDQEINEISVVGSGVKLWWECAADQVIVTMPKDSDMNELATVFKREFK